jgi:hypothetical protein
MVGLPHCEFSWQMKIADGCPEAIPEKGRMDPGGDHMQSRSDAWLQKSETPQIHLSRHGLLVLFV